MSHLDPFTSSGKEEGTPLSLQRVHRISEWVWSTELVRSERDPKQRRYFAKSALLNPSFPSFTSSVNALTTTACLAGLVLCPAIVARITESICRYCCASGTVPLLRGMRDYLPSCFAIRQSIENEARRVSRLYGYQEVDTPVVEETSLFRRTLGSGSDVVQKEMFEFKDKSSTEVTLRPEGTAGIGRMITRKDFALYRSLPHRFFYCGPMFRYERPQKGRQRQFSQVGVECIGEESSLADAEVVVMAHQFLDGLELASSPTLQINTLGDVEDRLAYKAELTNFLQERKEKLSVDSLNRLERGAVLRILDSKESNDKELLKGAPRLEDFLSERSSTRFENVLRALKKEGIPFERSSHLVRGLDYYCHTVFEYVSSEIGAQGAVLAGGRYDGLIESLGGPPTPAVGWAAGTDRLALLRTETIDSQFLPICAIIPTGNHNKETEDLIKGYCMRVAGALRRSGIETHLQYKTRYTSKLLATALQNGASAAIFIGENEVSRGKFILKDLKSRAEREVSSIDELADAVSNILNAFS